MITSRNQCYEARYHQACEQRPPLILSQGPAASRPLSGPPGPSAQQQPVPLRFVHATNGSLDMGRSGRPDLRFGGTADYGREVSATGVADSSFLEACRDGEDNRIRQLMTSRNLKPETVNFRDRTGKTGVSHICTNGNLQLLELITPIPHMDINLSDNEGNTPLHFAAQAGHVEILHHLVSHFKHLHVDQRNTLGFTPLMKASLQGRTKCVKLLLTAGASPVLRDHGRGFCASEWARFCGRQSCAEVIEKFMKNAHYNKSLLRKQMKDFEKWNSEPNLQFLSYVVADPKADGWLRQKLKRAFKQTESNKKADYSVMANLTNVALCASSPLVPSASPTSSNGVSNGNGTPPGTTLPRGNATEDNCQPFPLPSLHVTDASSVFEMNYMNSNSGAAPSDHHINHHAAAVASTKNSYAATKCSRIAK